MRIILAFIGIALALITPGVVIADDAGGAQQPVCDGASISDALQRTLSWIEAHPRDWPDTGEKIGNYGLSLWSWVLFATMHPDEAVRARCAREASRALRAPLRGDARTVGQRIAGAKWQDWIQLSYFATLLANAHVLDDAAAVDDIVRVGLGGLDLPKLHAETVSRSASTAFWTFNLLHHAAVGRELPVSKAGTKLAEAAALHAEGKPPRPSIQYVSGIYHELAALSNLGHAPLVPAAADDDTHGARFTARELDVARAFLPALVALAVQRDDADMAAEGLIAASLLGQRGEAFFVDGVHWLVERQNDDGTWKARRPGADAFRHGVIICSWALFEAMKDVVPDADEVDDAMAAPMTLEDGDNLWVVEEDEMLIF